MGIDFIIKYLSNIKDVQKGASDIQKINKQIADTMGKDFAQASKIIGNSLSKITNTTIKLNGRDVVKSVEQIGTVVQTTDGKFKEFIRTQTSIAGSLQKTSGAMKDVTSQFGQTDVATAKLESKTKNLGSHMFELAKRALIVVPIWNVMRNALNALTSAFTNSFAGLAKESLSLEKARQTLQGSLTEIKNNFAALKKESEELALQTGVDQDKIIAVFTKFSSIGLSYENAMTAANAATKLAVITQSDAAESADGFATSLNVLIDKTKTAEEQSKQITGIFSLIGELAQTNGFNVTEFSNSFEKFAVTAKSANFTTSQTISLLATLSKSGLGQAGNVFRNSLGQLLSNLDQLAGTLGIKVNPELDTTFDILTKVLEQINKLQKTGDLKGLSSARDALKDIFGGSRGAVPITALATLSDSLKANLAVTGDIDKLNKRFEETAEVTGSIIARIHNMNKEMGEAFLTGLFGGENLNEALERMLGTLTALQKNAEGFGNVVSKIFRVRFISDTADKLDAMAKKLNEVSAIQAQITEGFRGNLNIDELTKIINTLSKANNGEINIGLNARTTQEAVQTLLKIKNDLKTQNTKDALNNIFGPNSAAAIKKEADAIIDLQLKKDDFLKVEALLKKQLSASGLDEIQIEEKVLELRKVSGQFFSQDLKLQEELVTNLKAIESIELNRARARGIVDTNVENLRVQGASTVEQIKYKNELEKSLNLNQTKRDLLNKQLELEKAITAEQLGRNQVSSEAIKLLEITKTNGIAAAKAIADVLSGKTDFASFVQRGGDNLEIFKKQFADQFKTQEVNAFLEGRTVKGLNEVRGGNRLFETPELSATERDRLNRDLATNNQQELINRLTGGNATNVIATVPVTIAVNIDPSKLSEMITKFTDEVTKQLPTAGSKINNALIEALNGKQGNNI